MKTPQIPFGLKYDCIYQEEGRYIVMAKNDFMVMKLTWDGSSSLWTKMESFIRVDTDSQ